MKKQSLIVVCLSGSAIMFAIIYLVFAIFNSFFKMTTSLGSGCQLSQATQYLGDINIIQLLCIILIVIAIVYEVAVIVTFIIYSLNHTKYGPYQRFVKKMLPLHYLLLIVTGSVCGHSIKMLIHLDSLVGCSSNPQLIRNFSNNIIVHIVIIGFQIIMVIIRIVSIHQYSDIEPYGSIIKQQLSDNSKELFKINTNQLKSLQIDQGIDSPGKYLPNSNEGHNHEEDNHENIDNKHTEEIQQDFNQKQKEEQKHTASEKKKKRLFGRTINIPPKVEEENNPFNLPSEVSYYDQTNRKAKSRHFSQDQINQQSENSKINSNQIFQPIHPGILGSNSKPSADIFS